jgi:ComF family protein
MHTHFSTVRKLTRSLRFFCFPPQCPLCTKESLAYSIHENCLAHIPLHIKEKHGWIISLFPYNVRLAKDFILFLKKYNQYTLPDTFHSRLNTLLSTILEKHTINTDKAILIPIPARNERMEKQGFNQATVLAELFSEILSTPLRDNLLINNPHAQREKQAFLQDRSERIARLANTFTTQSNIHEHIPKDAHIILIDDVTTSGATFAEARRALEQVGFEKIIAVSLAG